jgi:hypothetical protein
LATIATNARHVATRFAAPTALTPTNNGKYNDYFHPNHECKKHTKFANVFLLPYLYHAAAPRTIIFSIFFSFFVCACAAW